MMVLQIRQLRIDLKGFRPLLTLHIDHNIYKGAVSGVFLGEKLSFLPQQLEKAAF